MTPILSNENCLASGFTSWFCSPLDMHRTVSPTGPAREFHLCTLTSHCDCFEMWWIRNINSLLRIHAQHLNIWHIRLSPGYGPGFQNHLGNQMKSPLVEMVIWGWGRREEIRWTLEYLFIYCKSRIEQCNGTPLSVPNHVDPALSCESRYSLTDQQAWP